MEGVAGEILVEGPGDQPGVEGRHIGLAGGQGLIRRRRRRAIDRQVVGLRRALARQRADQGRDIGAAAGEMQPALDLSGKGRIFQRVIGAFRVALDRRAGAVTTQVQFSAQRDGRPVEPRLGKAQASGASARSNCA